MENRLYSDLTWLWRMWGDPEGEYADFVNQTKAWIDKYKSRNYKTLLDLGCGGGKFVYSLKKHFEVTGLDISPDMLALCKELNPEVTTVLGDMRDFNLGRMFDIIFVDDAISFITNTDDLQRVLDACHRHLADDGLVFLTPDVFREDFRQNETAVFQSLPHPRHPDTEVVYITNNYDPDPADDHYECLFLYIIRTPRELQVEKDLHHLGLFGFREWEQTIHQCGFDDRLESYREDGREYRTFILSKLSR